MAKGRDDHSMDEWYQIYLDKFYEQPGAVVDIGPDDEVQYFGYRSKKKLIDYRKRMQI